MPRPCALCSRPDRAEIDRAITGGIEPFRRIATRCDVSEAAVRRHASRHIPEAIVAAAAEQQHAEIVNIGGDILGQIHDLHQRAMALLTCAEAQNDRRSLLGALREARACLELLARLQGQLQERAAVQVNVIAGGEWQRLRGVILAALRAHPEAAQAVALALTHEVRA